MGLGVNLSITPTTTPSENFNCEPEESKLTLEDLQGTGTCLISSANNYSDCPYGRSCSTHMYTNRFEYIRMYFPAPFRDTVGLHIWSRWICNSGTPEFRTWEGNLCILTYSLPQEHMYTREESRNNCLYIKDTPAVSAKA